MANSTRRRQTASEEMLQAAWETVVDLETDYQVEIRQCWSLASQRGVFEITLSAYSTHPSDEGAKLESIRFVYPNASTASLETQLFQAVVNLGRLLSDRPIPYRPA